MNLAKQFDDLWVLHKEATIISPHVSFQFDLPSRQFKDISIINQTAKEIQNTCIMYGMNMLLIYEIEQATAELSAYLFCTDPPVAVSRYMLEKDWDMT